MEAPMALTFAPSSVASQHCADNTSTDVVGTQSENFSANEKNLRLGAQAVTHYRTAILTAAGA
jgi:hypothetical protein